MEIIEFFHKEIYLESEFEVGSKIKKMRYVINSTHGR